MKKSELYNTILDKVCEVCEVRRTTLVSASKMQAVEKLKDRDRRRFIRKYYDL